MHGSNSKEKLKCDMFETTTLNHTPRIKPFQFKRFLQTKLGVYCWPDAFHGNMNPNFISHYCFLLFNNNVGRVHISVPKPKKLKSTDLERGQRFTTFGVR